MHVDKTDQLRWAILQVLSESAEAAGAQKIVERLRARGFDLPARTVRYHLALLDRQGLTRLVSRRRGRELTARGFDELVEARVVERLGFIAARMDDLIYRMTLNGRGAPSGTVVVNLAELNRKNLVRALHSMRPVFRARLGMGSRLLLAREGDQVAGWRVPSDSVVLGTVCSVVVSGILAKRGIPVTTRYGGLLELRDRTPVRFTALIEYRGTTLDPLELFIAARMTSVLDCARIGTGRVGASFREAPAAALADIEVVRQDLRRLDMDAILLVGRPNQPLLDIPVREGRVGIVVLGGLNPVAALQEAGIPVRMQSLAGLEDVTRFQPFDELWLSAREPGPLID